jgi:hypothetical protein
MTTRHSQAAKPERPVKPYRCTGTTSLRGAEKPAKRGMTPESRKLRGFQGLDEITIRKRTYHAGAKREAMYLTRIPQELRLVLAGLTYCANCHSAMVRLGPDYTCHARVNLTPDSCPDNTINADRLLRLVVSQVVGAVMIGPTIRKVTETIQKDAAEMSSRLQEHLEETELALEELDRLGDDLLTPKDQTDGDTTISLKEMVDISNKQIALAFEAGTTRRQSMPRLSSAMRTASGPTPWMWTPTWRSQAPSRLSSLSTTSLSPSESAPSTSPSTTSSPYRPKNTRREDSPTWSQGLKATRPTSR